MTIVARSGRWPVKGITRIGRVGHAGPRASVAVVPQAVHGVHRAGAADVAGSVAGVTDGMDRTHEVEGGRRLRRLVGVYDADHTLRGELSYWVGARFGRAHCALCDITHGTFREKADWQACRLGLPVPFDTLHRDDQPDAVRAAVAGAAPVVVAEVDGGGIVPLLDGAALDACGGSVDALVVAVEKAVGDAGLAWPGA